MIEDEYLVAEEIRMCLTGAGFSGIEYAATQDEALKCISEGAWDAAILDANLDGRGVDAIADMLSQRGVPFVIVTGYNRKSLLEGLSGVTVVEKPFRPKTLVNAGSGLFAK
jgi:DNA-binding response OmpR family regulator